MRWFVGVVSCLITMTAHGQDNRAEKLYRSMEKKVREAKSLKLVCTVKGRISADGEQIVLRAAQQFSGGSKARFKLRSKTIDDLFVSDGKQMVVFIRGRRQAPKPANARLNEGLTGAIARGGFMLPRLVFGQESGSFNAEKILLISRFKLRAKERIGKVDAQPVEYSVKFGGSAIGPMETVRVTVWINPKSLLPLKRKVIVGGGEKDYFTELYSEFVVNPKLDETIFRLPK